MAIGRGAFKPLLKGGSVVTRNTKPKAKPRKRRRRSTSENYTQNKANASGSTREN